MSINELLDSFLALDVDQRTEFLSRAYEAHTLPFDQQWVDEIQRRSSDSDAGRMASYDWEEVRKAVREKYLPNS